MSHVLKFFSFVMITCSFLFPTGVSALDIDIFKDNDQEIQYCNNAWECGLEEGIQKLQTIESIETQKSASEYIQDVVSFSLTFLAIVAVIYIIYAWFNILISAGDEEKMKKSKTTIIFVIIGLIIIFFATPILSFVLNIFDVATSNTL